MRVWKQSIMALSVMLATAVQAEEAKTASNKTQPRHMVDMADQLSTQEFYDSKNPDALWSSELKMPWAKTGAINAYEGGEAAAAKQQAGSATTSTTTDTAAAASAAATAPLGEVNGQTVDADQLVNIRVLYTLTPETSRASHSPVSAQNELFRQMSRTCKNGFQKIAEWSEPEGEDYYLYYQFKCMAKR